MKAVGVIVEFNPFHNGHGVHLRESRELSGRDRIVAVMSGNFVQRGEPALCDKWRRTKMALLSGVDIVIEIPVPYVIAGADYFARAGVGLLAATGVVDALSFGSEAGDLSTIKEAGRVLAEEPPAYKNALREKLAQGASFATARGAALEACLGETPDGLLTKPNNGLAMEYCKALRLLGDPMEIFTTHRTSGGPSATKIRRAFNVANDSAANTSPFRIQDHLPPHALEILEAARKNGETATLNDFSSIFRYLLSTRDFDLGEGLENRFRKLNGDFATLSDFLSAAKTKRYTLTRLQRAALKIILNITAADMAHYENHGGAQYIRVLGFRKNSSNLLGEITKKATLPVITNGAAMDSILQSNTPAAKLLAKELEAGDIYRTATNAPGGFRSERGNEIIIV
ncbi:MAG: nucleotidyltransferase family protein [Defluviitaleaceae bacterium]|nr:nucleotidyltransferase family protein [Defluviitaleaceae bacterium]MCL2263652.1 nucleotidyltransferase family protein [Defluviitaleaceae bacterium]MCL2263885.1 nucleotidyltransferase family protein [Defluviitaleaceae bacterium]